MRTMKGRTASRAIAAGVAVAAAAMAAPAARADDTERVKELEERLAQMEQLLEGIQDRGGYAAGYASELEARVAELEKVTDQDGKGLFWTGVGGLKGQTADKKNKVQIGGRIMTDWVGWSSERDTEAVVGDQLTTGTEFRRSRLFMAGTIYDNVIYKKFADEMTRFRSRPEVHMAPRFVDTGTIEAHDGFIYGLESGFASGPFHAQAEYFMADVDRLEMSDVSFAGFSVQAGFFVTGEGRPYKGGKWARVKPKQNYGDDGGPGAIEIAARFSNLDLNDRDIEGGEVDVITLGVNWYLNPNTRVMLNFQDIDLDDPAADRVQAVQIRFQIDF